MKDATVELLQQAGYEQAKARADCLPARCPVFAKALAEKGFSNTSFLVRAWEVGYRRGLDEVISNEVPQPKKNIIILHRGPDAWMVTYIGPHQLGIIQLFNSATVPTAFTLQASADRVLAELRQRDPEMEFIALP